MESRVLEALRFQLIKTTAYSVLQLVLKKEVASKFGCLSRYLADMASTGGLTSRYRPSVIAIAAVGLAESILKAEHPKQQYENLFNVKHEEKVGCFKELATILTKNKPIPKAIQKKYAS